MKNKIDLHQLNKDLVKKDYFKNPFLQFKYSVSDESFESAEKRIKQYIKNLKANELNEEDLSDALEFKKLVYRYFQNNSRLELLFLFIYIILAIVTSWTIFWLILGVFSLLQLIVMGKRYNIVKKWVNKL